MPNAERVAIGVRDVTLHEPGGTTVARLELVGVQVLVLARDRH